MRGPDCEQSSMFSYISAERRVPKDHPLRSIRVMADAALKDLDEHFNAMYAALGRPSIAPERLLRALLLQVLYTVRSERLLMEQLDYNFLFRWFVGLSIDEPVWDVTVFTKNRDRLLKSEVADAFFAAVLAQATSGACSRTSTLRSTALCLKPGQGRRALSAKSTLIRRSRPMILATRAWTFTVSSAAMILTSPRPIRRRCWRARAKAKSRS